MVVSPFILDTVATATFNRDIAPQWLLWYGDKQKLSAYYQYNYRHATFGSELWREASVKLADNDGKVAMQLADYFATQDNLSERLLWLKIAAQKGQVAAALALAQFHIDQNSPSKANDVLKPYIKNNEDALSMAIRIALMTGNKTRYLALVSQLKSYAPNANILKRLEKFSIFTLAPTYTESCQVNIQPIATTLADLERLASHIVYLNIHPLSNYLCFEQPLYIAKEQLACHHQSDERIQCHLDLQRKYPTLLAKYLLVLYPQGGANVDHGIIYIDREDTQDVLVHELLHSLGFVDEYPLPLNHQRCLEPQSAPFSLNIVTFEDKIYYGDRSSLRKWVLSQLPWRDDVKSTTPILKAASNGWKLGTDEQYQDDIGLFASATCLGKRNTRNVKAFKPTSSRTKLEYFELDVPALYWQLLDQQYRNFLMPHQLNQR